MCGINGIFAFHNAANAPQESELLASRDAMQARGPDGCGTWWSINRRCCLGHRRLSIIDLLDRAQQPMCSNDGEHVVVFNGEIYNFPELRAELEAEGAQFRTSSDTEVLLHLYQKYGQAMVQKLRGMFAFAIWDNAQRGLFLARDPYGIKPLYTANDGWTFRFASQVKALMAGGNISRAPEPAGVVGFYLLGSVPEPFTLYRDIRALPAGHTQWIDAAGPRIPQSFSNISAILANGSRNPVSRDEIPTRVRSAVLDSVKAHMLADVPVGIFLSAGVDSSALLGLMRDAGQRDTCAITLAFAEYSGTAEDELPLAARMAQLYGARHIARYVSEMEFRDDLPKIFASMDQPSIDGVNTWFVAKAAKEAGLKVAISGLGGDELLAGYPSFVDLPRWHHRFGILAALPGFGRLARAAICTLAPGFALAKPKALGMLEYADSWPGVYLLRRALYLPSELNLVLDPDIVREGLRRLRILSLLRKNITPDPGSAVGRVTALESSQYMRNQLLRDADWAGMAHSIEIRTPLVDFELLKSLAPCINKLTPGLGKAALAASPSIPLPVEVAERSKTGFGVPTGNWIANAAKDNTDPSRETNGSVSRRWSQLVMKAA